MQPLSIIAAMTRDRVIGHENAIPWHHSADLRHFRRLTTGHALIMGHATYTSIGRPLPKRRNIVVSRREGLAIEGCEVAGTLERAIERARETDPEPFVIGGEQVYRAALSLATRLYLTYVPELVVGDRHFPAYDESEWNEVERSESDGLTFVTLERGALAPR